MSEHRLVDFLNGLVQSDSYISSPGGGARSGEERGGRPAAAAGPIFPEPVAAAGVGRGCGEGPATAVVSRRARSTASAPARAVRSRRAAQI